jgi:hypothetical protein
MFQIMNWFFIQLKVLDEYESFVIALSMRTTFSSMVELSSLLLAHEARILTNLRSSSTSTVHLTIQSAGSEVTGSENSVYYAHNIRSQDHHTYRGRSYQPRGRGNNQRGRGRGSQHNFTQDQV